ncbi:TPA_asm: maturation protein [ssRNA phage Gerhypos.3_9]|uniref:Maturation protein n=2 Tax=Fiersviridae TaxID=2842319 RepID=A0A8S5L1T6_9VIRU|nr:maturation protein [ssRNA phage Gerhypos.3_9]QDH87676.1 MAG: hypothetical protein H3Bulk41463_000003 [Leviviridae sp.]DAD51822.1 TPA_asm: maturation protein [ssRNA phage Gerhypos.3_9]
MTTPNYNRTVTRNNRTRNVVTRASGTTDSGWLVNPITVAVTDSLTTVSVNTPNFRRLKRRILPWHPYSKSRDYGYTTGSYFNQSYYRVSGVDPILSGSDQYERNLDSLSYSWRTYLIAGKSIEADEANPKALSSLFDQIRLQKASSGVFLAEANKTAAHVAHTATRIYKAVKALKSARFGEFMDALGMSYTPYQARAFKSGVRRNFGDPGKGFRYDSSSRLSRPEQRTKFADFTAQSWLEYQYGWKPLLRDVYEHAEALARIGVETSQVVRRAKSRAYNIRDHRWRDSYSVGQLLMDNWIRSEKWAEYVVEYRIPDGALNVSNVFGLTNPLAIAWELVPFSFVVDWFYPIGSALEQLTATNGLVFHRGYNSTRHVLTRSVSAVGSAAISGGYAYVGSSNLGGSYLHFAVNRALLGSFPSVNWPAFKDPRSFSHAASAIALLKTLFLKG